MENPIDSITNSLNVIVLVNAIEELQQKFTDLNTLHEILTEQYHQTVINYNARFARLEQALQAFTINIEN